MNGTRRALVMAGGGLKVAYQAGVLQVWLDEAGVAFDLATGSSGGTLNLAMWTQGMSGTQIADAWRAYRPLDAATVPGLAWRGLFNPSLLTQAGLRERTLPAFGLDWHAIRTSDREAAFDVLNFTTQEHRVVDPAELTEDLLLSASALPLWFPPVRIAGSDYVDAVFATDANLDEAIRRGANELWVVWTVSTSGRWRPGFVNGYFQMIEAMANANLRSSLLRIEESNARIAKGEHGAYPHHVDVRVLAAEVPLHYLLAFRQEQFVRVVELGVRAARRWCEQRGIATVPIEDEQRSPAAGRGLSFRERLRGSVAVSDLPYAEKAEMTLELEVVIADVDELIADPEHQATVYGTVDCPALGGRLPVRRGRFDILTEHAVGDLRMTYDIEVSAPDGQVLLLQGEKFVRHRQPLQMWHDTTTLYVRVWEKDEEIAAGVLRLSVGDVLGDLLSMRGRGPTVVSATTALLRFADFFVSRLALAGPALPVRLPTWLEAAASR